MSRKEAKREAGNTPASRARRQRGGFVMGLVVGLLLGLALALGVALYITKAPVPFINKVPQRTPEQDNAEVERNRNWDPNALLGGKQPKPAGAGSGAAATPPVSEGGLPPGIALPPAGGASAATPRSPARDPAAILAGGATPAPAASAARAGAGKFVYFVQAGAFTRAEDAERQRARLALLGQQAKLSEREQAGRTVYRVRVGPFPSREEADGLQGKLQEQNVESQIVRVEPP